MKTVDKLYLQCAHRLTQRHINIIQLLHLATLNFESDFNGIYIKKHFIQKLFSGVNVFSDWIRSSCKHRQRFT